MICRCKSRLAAAQPGSAVAHCRNQRCRLLRLKLFRGIVRRPTSQPVCAAATPPVIGYIANDRFKLDLRTIFPHQDAAIVDAIRAACAK